MFRKIFTKSCLASASLFICPIICQERKREVYIWGNGIYQARPDAIMQFKNFVPKKIENLPENLVYLVFGSYYEAGIDDKNNLYIWDKHSPDADKTDGDRDHRREGIRFLQEDVKSVKFTSGYIWTLTHDEKVYQWPVYKKFNENQELIEKQLGEKREVIPLRGSKQISTGRDHIITLSNKGEVYAMGDDTFGQCGQCDKDRNTFPPFVDKRVTYPTKVKNLAEVEMIFAGKDHNLAIDKLGNIYGWGSNSNMQLSHEDEFSRRHDPLICSYMPIRINKNLDYSTVKNMAAGDQFSIAITENQNTKSSQIFSFGSNLQGQLGIDEIRHLRDVSKIKKLSNYVMKKNDKQSKIYVDQIECGNSHCIALLNIGNVVVWGENQHGQMGNKKRSNVPSPVVMKYFNGKKVVGVFASERNCAVITETNQQKDTQ